MARQQIARNAKQVGEAIRRQRRLQEMQQTELAEKSGLRQATISALESGAPGTHLRTVFDVLAALGLELVIQPRSRGLQENIEDLF